MGSAMSKSAWAVLCCWATALHAQAPAPSDVRPPKPATDTSPAKPAPAKPRQFINLSPAERQAIDAREAQAVKPASIEEALQPTPQDAKIERDETSGGTRIEQLRTSNRISEVIVTPRGAPFSYTMTNREGRQPFGTSQMSPGLSVPKFFRFEFGGPAPVPAEAASPAPAPPQPSK